MALNLAQHDPGVRQLNAQVIVFMRHDFSTFHYGSVSCVGALPAALRPGGRRDRIVRDHQAQSGPGQLANDLLLGTGTALAMEVVESFDKLAVAPAGHGQDERRGLAIAQTNVLQGRQIVRAQQAAIGHFGLELSKSGRPKPDCRFSIEPHARQSPIQGHGRQAALGPARVREHELAVAGEGIPFNEPLHCMP